MNDESTLTPQQLIGELPKQLQNDILATFFTRRAFDPDLSFEAHYQSLAIDVQDNPTLPPMPHWQIDEIGIQRGLTEEQILQIKYLYCEFIAAGDELAIEDVVAAVVDVDLPPEDATATDVSSPDTSPAVEEPKAAKTKRPRGRPKNPPAPLPEIASAPPPPAAPAPGGSRVVECTVAKSTASRIVAMLRSGAKVPSVPLNSAIETIHVNLTDTYRFCLAIRNDKAGPYVDATIENYVSPSVLAALSKPGENVIRDSYNWTDPKSKTAWTINIREV